MPSWLLLIIVLGGMILLVALEAAAVTGNWRTFKVAGKLFALYLGLLALPAALVGLVMFIWR